uniref:Uncharacterized protein n=1 Tax=Equus caballus TaxID=9796 RepID=A0A9L0RK64_HORSE
MVPNGAGRGGPRGAPPVGLEKTREKNVTGDVFLRRPRPTHGAGGQRWWREAAPRSAAVPTWGTPRPHEDISGPSVPSPEGDGDTSSTPTEGALTLGPRSPDALRWSLQNVRGGGLAPRRGHRGPGRGSPGPRARPRRPPIRTARRRHSRPRGSGPAGGPSGARSPAVAVALEVEPELEDAVGELAAEAVAVRVLPLAVDDLEGDVLVGRPRVEAQRGEVLVVGARLQEVLGRGALVDEVGVEDVELVALHDLGRRVVEVVVRLVVLVPLEARVHAVEEARLARPVLVRPQVRLARQRHLHAELRLVLAHALLGPPEEDVLGALARVPCGREAGRGHQRTAAPRSLFPRPAPAAKAPPLLPRPRPLQ